MVMSSTNAIDDPLFPLPVPSILSSFSPSQQQQQQKRNPSSSPPIHTHPDSSPFCDSHGCNEDDDSRHFHDYSDLQPLISVGHPTWSSLIHCIAHQQDSSSCAETKLPLASPTRLFAAGNSSSGDSAYFGFHDRCPEFQDVFEGMLSMEGGENGGDAEGEGMVGRRYEGENWGWCVEQTMINNNNGGEGRRTTITRTTTTMPTTTPTTMPTVGCGGRLLGVVAMSKAASTTWAGPTLMDIESALALQPKSKSSSSSTSTKKKTTTTITTTTTTASCCSASSSESIICCCTSAAIATTTSAADPPPPTAHRHANASSSSSSTSSSSSNHHHHHKKLANSSPPSPPSSSAAALSYPPTTPLISFLNHFPPSSSPDGGWRLKLQKRNQQEPKYRVQVSREEEAMDDGYRWRKYGQKNIKNSQYPRSYYKCSSANCNAKKQVERCQEDGLLQVTYEGIHLHYRPNPMPKTGTSSSSQGVHAKEKDERINAELSPKSSRESDTTFPPFYQPKVLSPTSSTTLVMHH